MMHYWCIMNEDSVPWDELYLDTSRYTTTNTDLPFTAAVTPNPFDLFRSSISANIDRQHFAESTMTDLNMPVASDDSSSCSESEYDEDL